jgi:hypothetical protein
MPLTLDGNTGVQGNSGAFVLGTAVASTSGTSIDFTSIPSWVKRITVMFSGVSTNGTSLMMIQIGAGSVTTSGYASGAWTANTANTANTTGFILGGGSGQTSGIYNGIIVLAALGSNRWIEAGTLGESSNPSSFGGASVSGGNITLGGTLDRVRITTVNGTDAFDAGTINILYE